MIKVSLYDLQYWSPMSISNFVYTIVKENHQEYCNFE